MTHSINVLTRVPGAISKQLRRIIATTYYQHYFENNPDHPSLDRDRAADAVKTADTLLFCCWGNICRSPMAAHSLRNLITGPRPPTIKIRSAGLGEYSGRPSPPTAVTVAGQYGVDLSDHRSIRTTPALIAESDVIFVMDYHTYHLLHSQHSDPGQVYFLSVFTDSNIQIQDPAGRPRQIYDDIYGTITSATDQIAAILNQPSRPDEVQQTT